MIEKKRDSKSKKTTIIFSNTVSIKANPLLLGYIYEYLISWQQLHYKTRAFKDNIVPKKYIEKTLAHGLIQCTIDIFFACGIYNKLIVKLREAQALIHPSLYLSIENNIEHHNLTFSLSCIRNTVSWELKNTPKKTKFPPRKKYRDLDKQAELIIEKETIAKTTYEKHTIGVGDWIRFSITPIFDKTISDSPLTLIEPGIYWLKITSEAPDKALHNLFLGKQKGDEFFNSSVALNEIVQKNLFCTINFKICILDHVPHDFFCFDKFKQFFSCRSQEDIILRIIDVLSLRQDIPLRTEITQIIMKSLFDCYKVSLPNDVLNMFLQDTKSYIIYNPDYIIYQAQPDFEKTMRAIAYKNALETVLIDFLIKQEKVTLHENDVYLFLNILQRPRFKHFHHFNYPILKQRTKELPIAEELINQFVLREKTIQHFVKTLAK